MDVQARLMSKYKQVLEWWFFCILTVTIAASVFAFLPSYGSWSCPGDHMFCGASVIWGLIGLHRMFGDLGAYSAVNWFFLVGAIAPLLVCLAHNAFPKQEWIRLINMHILIGATSNMLPAMAVNFTSWILAGFIIGFEIYRYRRDWWKQYNYMLSGVLNSGLAFMVVLLYFFLGLGHVSFF
ncbi:oligopeptide transporter 7-like [Aristolochia californica]|uniref:oligopeptide transporter 7-like n=1 Tax=Aristolochia californica TaxID=171875 RepID=UPI0035E082AE